MIIVLMLMERFGDEKPPRDPHEATDFLCAKLAQKKTDETDHHRITDQETKWSWRL